MPRNAYADSSGLLQIGFCNAGRFGMADVNGDGRLDTWCQHGSDIMMSLTKVTDSSVLEASGGLPLWTSIGVDPILGFCSSPIASAL